MFIKEKKVTEFELLDLVNNETIDCVINYTTASVENLCRYKFINCILMDTFPLKVYINELTIIEQEAGIIPNDDIPENICNISKMYLNNMEMDSLDDLKKSNNNFGIIIAKIENCEMTQSFIKLSFIDNTGVEFVATAWMVNNFAPYINSKLLFIFKKIFY